MRKEIAINIAPVFKPLLERSRYKAVWGGRGSGKSHFFATLLVTYALRRPGFRAVCIREVQRTLRESSKKLIEDKIRELGAPGFDIRADSIRTPGGGVILFIGMQDHTAESIKSLEAVDVAWVDEAQSLSERSLMLLRPTIRAPGSELWFSWNPRRPSDPVDKLFRSETPPTDSIIVKALWSDNPFFPQVLEQERLDCLRSDPEIYPHIWEGDYIRALSGAYYAYVLHKAREEGRIGKVPADPLLPLRLYVDIGGTGAKSDSFVIWVVQFVGREIRVLDYYEAQGQPLAAHLDWMRSHGYTPERCSIWLPHDGASRDKVYSVSYESALRDAGYIVHIVPNQGPGAARMRIEALRRVFPAIWIDEEKCKAGIEALGWYHERIDHARQIGLGPEHDWSSHAADALGMMAITYNTDIPKTNSQIQRVRRAGSAMAR